ncbi:MAG TPA: GNAT family N-acetyltransferase [Thermoanaerobaculia bacterium]|nr:GNAT family N-acetyltransferase [Thermoanaerobaculia bacterium]
MTDAPVFRAARPEDAPAVSRLLGDLGHPAPEPDVRARLADLATLPFHVVLVAEGASGVVGAASGFVTPVLHRPGVTGRISVMVVAESARGTGVGTRLLAAMEDALAARGATRLELTSNLKRADAHAFYERRGWTRQGYRFERTPKLR